MVAFNSWHHCSKEHHKGWLDKSALCISVKSYVQNYTDIKSFGLLNHKKKHSQADDVCENMWRQSDLVPVNICYSYKWSVLFTHNSWIVALAKNGVTIKGLLHSCMWTGDVEHSWAALQPASAVSNLLMSTPELYLEKKSSDIMLVQCKWFCLRKWVC